MIEKNVDNLSDPFGQPIKRTDQEKSRQIEPPSALRKLIDMFEEKCVNCHNCIRVCPVKFCNDGSGDHVIINKNLCIGCGQCITACTHGARVSLDDFSLFMQDLQRGDQMIAIVAPAVAANYPNLYENINGWIKSIGIHAIFDISFGAELTVKSYMEHITKNKPKAVIAQPCPAIVSYIEIYKPELLPYLAPIDSPMLHTIKIIKRFYPQYAHHKIVVFSPCVAKRREFDETGFGDYNVTFTALNRFFKLHNIHLASYPKIAFDNPPAERAVLFSTPGGLLRTAERWDKDIVNIARKVEGPALIYNYLDRLGDSIKKGQAPILIDGLNCELGCNGGTGTDCQDRSRDEIEYLVKQRQIKMQKQYNTKGLISRIKGKNKLTKLINQYWEPNRYNRRYINRSGNNDLSIPSQKEKEAIYQWS